LVFAVYQVNISAGLDKGIVTTMTYNVAEGSNAG
jgi:hypothetical protein